MVALTQSSRSPFLVEFMMGRGKFDPRDFGVEMERDELMDKICDMFNDKFHGQWSIDEVLLHPRESLNFCDEVRRENSWYMLPDDIILRCVISRRKNP